MQLQEILNIIATEGQSKGVKQQKENDNYKETVCFKMQHQDKWAP